MIHGWQQAPHHHRHHWRRAESPFRPASGGGVPLRPPGFVVPLNDVGSEGERDQPDEGELEVSGSGGGAGGWARRRWGCGAAVREVRERAMGIGALHDCSWDHASSSELPFWPNPSLCDHHTYSPIY